MKRKEKNTSNDNKYSWKQHRPVRLYRPSKVKYADEACEILKRLCNDFYRV